MPTTHTPTHLARNDTGHTSKVERTLSFHDITSAETFFSGAHLGTHVC
jgi:hypothetical protein